MCQRNVVTYNKDLRIYTHNATIKSLNAQREKLNKNNDGSGKITVYADQAGTVLSVGAKTDVAVKEGANVPHSRKQRQCGRWRYPYQRENLL